MPGHHPWGEASRMEGGGYRQRGAWRCGPGKMRGMGDRGGSERWLAIDGGREREMECRGRCARGIWMSTGAAPRTDG